VNGREVEQEMLRNAAAYIQDLEFRMLKVVAMATQLKQCSPWSYGDYTESVQAWAEDLLEATTPPEGVDLHLYLSTACHHDQHDRCRKTCKFCNTPCLCRCHGSEGGHS